MADGRRTPSPEETAVSDVPSLADRLARGVVGLETDAIPGDALLAAVDRVVDTVGVALAGARTPAGAAAARTALRREVEPGPGRGAAAVWGTGRRARAEDAVVANGTAAHALDYDDSDNEAIMHTGSIAVPTALAVGEELGASGREVLAATVCAYQVANIVGRLAFKRFQPNGFQAIAILGTFAAAAAAGRLRRLSHETLLGSFGICGGIGAGLMEFLTSGGETKPLQIGWSSHAALWATALAEDGARGPRTVLEGPYGVYRSFARTEVDPAAYEPFEPWDDFAVCRINTKFYPACHAIHAPANAWTGIAAELRERGLDPDRDVTDVVCAVGEFGGRVVLEPLEAKYRPQTVHLARFSLPYCLGRIAVDGRLTLDGFTEEAIADPRTHAFAEKVGWRPLTAQEEETTVATLEVTTSQGDTLRRSVLKEEAYTRAADESDRVVAKYRDVTGAALSPAQQDDLLRAIRAMYEEDRLDAFSEAIDGVVLMQ